MNKGMLFCGMLAMTCAPMVIAETGKKEEQKVELSQVGGATVRVLQVCEEIVLTAQASVGELTEQQTLEKMGELLAKGELLDEKLKEAKTPFSDADMRELARARCAMFSSLEAGWHPKTSEKVKSEIVMLPSRFPNMNRVLSDDKLLNFEKFGRYFAEAEMSLGGVDESLTFEQLLELHRKETLAHLKSFSQIKDEESMWEVKQIWLKSSRTLGGVAMALSQRPALKDGERAKFCRQYWQDSMALLSDHAESFRKVHAEHANLLNEGSAMMLNARFEKYQGGVEAWVKSLPIVE